MFLTKNLIAHRGIHDNKNIYENTLEAFQKAKEKNYIIELDVHLTKDNKIVVFHDYNTKRITGISHQIEESTYQEINNNKKIHIPTLEEVLTLIKQEVPLLIEIKQQNKVGQFEEKLMEILKKYKGEYAIQSFNPKTIYWFKKHHPNILRGQLACQTYQKNIPPYQQFILRNMFLNIITKPNFISYKYNELPLKKIKKYQRKKIPVLAWTISSKENYNKYKNIYDNLICEKFI